VEKKCHGTKIITKITCTCIISHGKGTNTDIKNYGSKTEAKFETSLCPVKVAWAKFLTKLEQIKTKPLIYTVNHKKRWQYICDHNFGKS